MAALLRRPCTLAASVSLLLVAGCAELAERKPPLDASIHAKLVPVLVVGAPTKRFPNGDRREPEGAAYVFGQPLVQRLVIEGEQPKWLFPMQRLRSRVLENSRSGDQFGRTSVLADFDGDGTNELIVAVPGAGHPQGQRPGLLNVLRFENGAFRQDQLLTKGFGRQLGLPGFLGDAIQVADFTGDGHLDLITSSPGHPIDDVAGRGALYLFRRQPDAQVAASQRLFPPSPFEITASALEGFEGVSGLGTAMAVGDFDNDGRPDLAAVAPRHNPDGDTSSGVLIEFRGTGGAPGLTELRAHDEIPFARPGDDRRAHALVAGRLDNDEFDDLAVGIPAAGAGVPGAPDPPGGLVIFRGGPDGLSFSHSLDTGGFQGLGNGDKFGMSLTAGDFDGDGRIDLAVGAPLATSALFGGIELPPDSPFVGRPGAEAPPAVRVSTGRVYVYRGTPDGFRPWRALGHGDERQIGQEFGTALHAADMNGDGKTDLAVGAPGRTASPTSIVRSGGVLVYAGGIGGFTLVQTLTQAGLDDAEDGDEFGLRLNN